ncbi:mRNA cap guanine-N7 methyltransferase [Tieghemiomyces parasiticus]|uniref:mRNA cap guanine-N(7) methyltransferase n=1 Tax=Tieghemiomyces parasiticus TaxID=78921 RepID=A0A9W8A1A4_9FUNG|nr:mRNA cap guanine-N7 methyltransferase [Tieghemiomyces parasiticus]
MDPKPPAAPTESSAQHVASHYNSRPELGLEKRRESKIIRLRKFNNWVKATLIQRFCRRGFRVLDIGCGKGGDLGKWGMARIGYYVGIDIAAVSIEQAQARYNENRRNKFSAEFHALDCYRNSLQSILPRDFVADIVSMQFCMHYAFATEQTARQMLQNVAQNLRPDGIFIGTTPDANWLVFGNAIYQVEFENKTDFSLFGHRYRFTLEDAVDDCPEYLVHFPTFERMAAEYGLQLIFQKPFHEYYQSLLGNQDAVNTLYSMGVVTDDGATMSRDEWEAAGLYLAFAFRKIQR